MRDTWQAMCVTRGKPCVNMHASRNVYKWEVIPIRRGRAEQKGKEKEKGNGEKGKKERERERGRKGSWCSDGRKSSDQEVVYPISSQS